MVVCSVLSRRRPYYDRPYTVLTDCDGRFPVSRVGGFVVGIAVLGRDQSGATAGRFAVYAVHFTGTG